jgi:hypothetical protein
LENNIHRPPDPVLHQQLHLSSVADIGASSAVHSSKLAGRQRPTLAYKFLPDTFLILANTIWSSASE